MLRLSLRGFRAHRFPKARTSAFRSAALRQATDPVMESLEGRVLYTAAPTSVAAVALSSSQVQVVWQNNAADETGFDVKRSIGSGGWTDLGTTSPGTTTFSDTALSASTAYNYEVFAVGGAGGTSSAGTASATTPAAPAAAPLEPDLSAATASTSEIDLTYATSDGAHLTLEAMGPADSNYHQIADLGSPTTSSDQSYAVTGLATDMTYCFRIRADNGGQSVYSGIATANTCSAAFLTADSGAPAAPDGLTVSSLAPDSFQLSDSNDDILVLSVSSPEYSGLGVNWWSVYENNLYSINPGTTYTIWARAANPSTYALSAPTLVTVTTPGSLPAAPTDVAVAQGSGSTADVSWSYDLDTPGLVGFSVYEANADGARCAETFVDSSTTTANLAGDANSTYVVTAMISAPIEDGGYFEESKFSAPVTLSSGSPTAPDNVSATPYSEGVHILWDNSSANETGFVVQRSLAGAATWSDVGSVGADVTQFDDTTVSPGTEYDYRVAAVGGSSSYSSTVTTTALVLPTVSVAAVQPDASFGGADGHLQDGWFDFHRTGDLSAALTVAVSGTGSTASSGTDYADALPTGITFEAGQQDVLVAVVPANGSADSATYLQATISSGTGYTPDATPASVDLAAHA